MSLSPHPIDPTLTAIAIAYMNQAYIADMLAPRIRTDAQKFTFLQYSADTYFNVPDTRVGRRSKPNEVQMESSEVADFCEDYALDGGVPMSDQLNAESYKDRAGKQIYDPLGREVMFLQELVALDREKRVANIVFNPATYDAALRLTLAGGDKFSAVGSDPIGVINEQLDKPLVRPNQITFGQAGWTKFRSHPQIVEAVKGTGAKEGNATREQVAELFEVDEIHVGSARANSTKRGQAPQLVRLWDATKIALTHKAPVPDARGALTFLGSFQWGDRMAAQWFEKDMGMRGGTAVRTGESLRERVIASQAGFLIEDAF